MELQTSWIWKYRLFNGFTNYDWAEVLIQGILTDRIVDMDEVEEKFTNMKMISEIKKYVKKTEENNLK